MEAYARLLGVPQLRLADTSYDPPESKATALLYYLACKGGWCNRDELLYLFYPDSSESTARSNLRQRLAAIRRLPYGQGVEVEGNRLRWPIETDVQAFKRAVHEQQWAQAIELYQGELLEGVILADTPGFEDWLEAEREAFHSHWRHAVLALVKELEATGRYSHAAEVLERLYKTNVLDEEVLRCYLQVLALGGQRSKALTVFAAFKEQLLEELDIEPDPVTLRLVGHIERSEQGPSLSPSIPSPRVEDKQARHNLPAQATAFVGREAEKERLSQLLSDPTCRLVTIVGPGGMGKTRLGIEAARERLEDFKDGVFFVNFVPVASADLMVYAISSALGFSFFGQQEPKAQLLDYLKNKEVLLVLDNLEHLLSGVELVSDLLEQASYLKVVATSRERLNLYAEQVFNLYGLSLPEEGEEARDHDAVKLFVQRAGKAHDGFILDDTNLPTVIRICQLLRGLPLAIELAASWLRALAIEEIAAEIERGIDFLETATRDLPERHRSIRAAFDHSWKLLTEEEQTVLRKLSVCQGGFRREAAAEIAGATLTILAALVDKSFLTFTPSGRYRRHPLVIQYSQEKLAEQPEENAQAEERHSLYYLRFMQARSKELYTQKGKEASAAIEEEHPNLRAAWSWIIQQQRWGEFNTYAFTLEHIFMHRAPEGVTFLAEAVAALDESQPEHQVILGYLLGLQSQSLFFLQYFKEAKVLAQRSLEVLRPTGDTRGIAYALYRLGGNMWTLGDSLQAKPLLEEGLVLSREHPELRITGWLLQNLAFIAQEFGTPSQVEQFYKAAFAELEQLDEPSAAAMQKVVYGMYLAQHARAEDGERFVREGLGLLREVYFPRLECYTLNNLALVTVELGKDDEAEALAFEALALAKKLHMKDVTSMAKIKLAKVALRRGKHPEARHHLRESLEITWALKYLLYALEALVVLVRIAIAEGKPLEAAKWLGLVQEQPTSKRRVGYELEPLLESLQHQLTIDELDEALKYGRMLKLEEVVPELLRQLL